MTERVWQLVSRTTVAQTVASRPRLALLLVMLVMLVAMQGVGAAETSVSTNIDGATTDGTAVTTGP